MTIARLAVLAFALGASPLSAQTRAAITALPSGFGLSHGMAAVTLSGVYSPNGILRPVDGDMGLAAGFGDPVSGIGFAVSADITSLADNFADSGYFNVTAHRQFRFSGGYGSVSATVSGIGAFGGAAARSVGGTLAASWVFGTASRPYMVTAGLSNDLTMVRTVEGILGFGVGVNESWAVSAAIFGDSNAIGVTYFPPSFPGTVVQVSLRNLDDPLRRGVGVDIGYAFNLFGN